jgi:hypothetical protein
MLNLMMEKVVQRKIWQTTLNMLEVKIVFKKRVDRGTWD